MEGINQKAGLNENFRQHVIDNMIMKKLIEWGQNTTKPVFLSKLKEIGVRFEGKIYGIAESKDDYVDKIQKKLNSISRSFFGDAAASTVGHQPVNTIISRQAVHCDQSPQQSFSVSASTQESQKLYPTPHQLHVSQQRPMPTSYSTLQQSIVSMQPASSNQSQEGRLFERQNGLYPSVQQIRPMREPIRTTNSILNTESCQQSSQLGGSVMKPQEQGTRYQDTRVHQSNKPSSTPLHCQTLGSEKKNIPGSQVACTNAAAFTSFVDAETINATADLKLLIAQYHRARTLYLPDLMNMEKKAEKEFVKAQSVDIQEKAKRLRFRFQQMIKFLHLPEDDLMRIPKETMCRYLNNVTEVLNRYKTSIMPARNQAPQYPNRQIISSNHQQNIPSVNTTTSMSAEKQTPQYPKRQKISVNHHQNTPSVNTTTSISAENQAPQYPIGPIISPNKQQNTPSANTTTFVTRPIICSSTMANSKDPNMQTNGTAEQNDDLMKQNPEPMHTSSMNRPDLPIDRLIKVLQSVSKEALKNSMDDIASAINDMDKLPEYASYDDSKA